MAKNSTTTSRIDKLIPILLYVLAGVLLLAVVTTVIIKVIPQKPKVEDRYINDTTKPVNKGELPVNPRNFDNIQADHEDVCAWIKFDCLDIDYPIVRAGETKENEYYLRRDLDGNYSTAGTIFIQKMNNVDFNDNCTVVYGHNMTNLSMFGTLKNFRNKEFFDQNPYFEIYTPRHILKYEIKSAFVYDDRHLNNSFNNFADEVSFMNFAEEASNPKSLVKNVREGLEIKWGDKLVVLSTCTNYDPERYLVVAKLIEDIKTQ